MTREPVRYYGAGGVAAWLGVKPELVTKWLGRYASTAWPTPEPDALAIPGRHGEADSLWLESRKDDWLAWEASRPGRGAGGGRPRSDKKE